MQSTFCSQCHQPLAAGTAFCVNCGTPQQPGSSHTPADLIPPAAPVAKTVRAGAPSPGADYAPTQYQPPSSQGQDVYGSQYAPAPPAPLPSPHFSQAGSPVYAPGPPAVVIPGGGVAPWAQPPKKRSGAKVALGCLVALLLVAAVLGGGGFLLVKGLSSRSGATTHQGSGTTATPGAGNTPGRGSTPGGSPAGTQTLNTINRQAIYAGANITILSAQEGTSLPDYQESDPTKNALSIQAKVSNQTPLSVYPKITVFAPDGSTYELRQAQAPGFGISWISNSVTSGAWFFDVPKPSAIGDFKIQFGSGEDAPVTIPLTGVYDPKQWQQVTHQIGQTVTYDKGQIKGTVTQIVVGTWSQTGYQAPKGMRFLLMYLHVTNNTALAINVGDGVPPQYLLVFPNGDRSQPTYLYGSQIDAVVQGGESKDVGYDTFLIPTAPAPYMLVFLNPDGSTAGQVNLGTV